MRIIKLTYSAPDRTPKVPDCWMCMHCPSQEGMTVALVDWFGPGLADRTPWGVQCLDCGTMDTKAFEEVPFTMIFERNDG